MTADEIIAVVTAHKDGKRIQSHGKTATSTWTEEQAPCWNFLHWDYRTRPEPKQIWVLYYKGSPCSAVFLDKAEAEACATNNHGSHTVHHFREVLDT